MNGRPQPTHPADRPRTYVTAFAVLMATSVAFPDGFMLVALAAGALVVIVWIVLLVVIPKKDDPDGESRSP